MVKDYHGNKFYHAELQLNGCNIVFYNEYKDDEYQCLLNSE